MEFINYEKICGSPFWDLNRTWYTESPQFTPCFEKTVLVWFPALFLLLYFFIDLYRLYVHTNNRNTGDDIGNVPRDWKTYCKMMILILLSAVCGFELDWNIKRRQEVFPVDIIAPTVKVASILISGTLFILHRKFGRRTSDGLFIFWFLTALSGLPQFYSSIFQVASKDVTAITYIIYYGLSILMLLFHFCSDRPPRPSPYSLLEDCSPEESASLPSRMTFSWFDKTVWLGYKRTLVHSDLWPLEKQNRSSTAYASFNKYWEKTRAKKIRKINRSARTAEAESSNVGSPFSNTKIRISIFPILFKAFGSVFICGAMLETASSLLSFLSPLLLECMIGFVENDEPHWRGYLYASLLLLVAVMRTIFENQYLRLMSILDIRINSSLTSAIYRKVLRLSNASRKEWSTGEIDVVMSVDAKAFTHGVYYMNTIWMAPLVISLSLYFLWQLLGPCSLVGLAVMILVMPIHGYISKKTTSLLANKMQTTGKRAEMLNEILSGIKVLKLYAWEPSFEKRVTKIREKEINILKKNSYLRGASSLVFSCTPFLISILTYATYIFIDERNVLDSVKIFVSWSLFDMIDTQLIMIKYMISVFIQMVVSIKRMNKFLNSEELDPEAVSQDSSEEDALVIENGTFTWGLEENPILKDINFRIKPGSLVAVVGTVGTGKSSLISALLGEMYKLSGNVKTKGSVAYVPQVAWIQNCTLRDNILFKKPFNSRAYQKVIESCALKTDLEVLPAGDQTEIGEKGINLSGGQKQRVSLARAVYSECDVYLLDDPLSAVDSHVGKHIFENVIGSQGILRKKTRLLVTHSTTFLHEVDMILVIKDETITESGTYQELLDKNGEFSDFIKNYSEGNNGDRKDTDGTSENEVLIGNLRRRVSRQNTVDSNSSATSTPSKTENKHSEQQARLIEEEEVEAGRVKWPVFVKYLRAIGWFMFTLALFVTILDQAFVIASGFWLSKWSDDKSMVVNGTVVNSNKRNMYILVYGLLGFSQAIADFLSNIFWCIGTLNAGIVLHTHLLQNIMRSPLSFFDTTPTGRILNRFTKDFEVLDDWMPWVMSGYFTYLSTIIGILIVVSFSTPIFMMMIIPIVTMYYLVMRFYIVTSLQIKRLMSVSESPVYSHFNESCTGYSVIRAYQSEKRFINELEQKVDSNRTCAYFSSIDGLWLTVRLQTLGNLIIFFAALFAVISRESISPGLVGLSISFTLQVTHALDMYMYYATELESDIIAVERIKKYSEIEQEADWDIVPSPVGNLWPKEGQIDFIDFQLRYREGLDCVLKGLSFTIKGGEKVGIVGRTGAGKSSVTLSIFRIIESAGGRILIDGVDISKLGLHTLRSRLTIIPQDPVLFSGNLRMNLDPFDRHTDDEIWRALDLAQLHSFVAGLPTKLEHDVTEGGNNLSVGQRQLVCLARALLNKTKILILDEATGAVDLETDDFIQKTIRKAFSDCTVLTIAHRINTIMDSDRVLVLDQGELVEFEAPSILLNNPSSSFFKMAREAGVV